MDALAPLRPLVDAGGVVALTGAGLSTDSGIPDYRGSGRAPRRQIQHAEFVGDPAARARYWARSAIGYPRLAAARPNAGHRALAKLAAVGRVRTLITQNVDGLDAQAGTPAPIELHGSLHRVECLGCGEVSARASLQARLLDANPWLAERAGAALPDGDAAVEPDAAVEVPACLACGGVLRPQVVFFGGNVAAPLVARCRAAIDEASLLLVVGSSLTVFSGYRFVLHARDRGVPVAIVNRGPTRGDPLATWRLDVGAAEALGALASAA